MLKKLSVYSACLALWMISCSQESVGPASEEEFVVETEQFADLRILRYQVPGFDSLPLKTKKLIYYLNEAGLSGRDMIWDQNYRHNLRIRKTLENIVQTYQGDRESEEWKQFLTYTKRVWFSNGIHHHYSNIKLKPEFTPAYFQELIQGSRLDGFPLFEGASLEEFSRFLEPILFDPTVDAKKVNLDPDVDQVAGSAVNFYDEELTQAEVEAFYAALIDKEDPEPISYGLNSKLVKEDGELKEKRWKVGGMYGSALEEAVSWLEKAATVAENETQQAAIEKLIEYYRTGDLEAFDEFSVLWVEDTSSSVDWIHGFIEVYNDPLGYKGSYEALVWFPDLEATRRIDALSKNAQWFEDHSPLLEPHKKPDVKGISASVITVVGEAGDSSPSTPIGINLPNANWIRSRHGSKSVSLGNIVDAYNESSKTSGILEEFAPSPEEIERSREHGTLASALHTDLHEVVGHASGQLEPGVGTPKETLKSYASALEEARADLFALYFLLDPKLIELGVMPTLDVGKAEYDSYIRNALLIQLARLQPGENLEEAHMRNRHMIAQWAYEQGRQENVIEKKVADGKTYYVINDYERLRELFGSLLREVQRIKSEGDYEAGKALVENYGVRVEPDLHREVLERYQKLNRAPYAGFINPVLTPVENENGEITDIQVSYPDDFTRQMLDYGARYSFLPLYN